LGRPNSTASAIHKFNWALKKIEALNEIGLRFTESDPCAVVGQCELKTRKHTYTARIFEQPTDPVIQLLIGDVAHNLRQGLDHLAYRLAIIVARADPPPNERTSEFPIFENPTEFKAGLRRKIGPRADMPTGLEAALDGLQPYQGGELELLGALHILDNTDKHRLPPVVASAMVTPNIVIEEASGQMSGLPRAGRYEDGAEAWWVVPEPNSEVNVDFHVTSGIAFAETSPVAAGQPVIGFLMGIGEVIRTRVLPALAPFF
jgi:hypothetical protein